MDDRRIYDFYIAGRSSAALAAAVRLGLFEILHESPRSTGELAKILATAVRPTGLLLTALKAMGLVEEDGELWSLAEDATTFLTKDNPHYIGGLIDLEVANYLTPEKLLKALRLDRPSVYGDEDPWEAHIADPEKARAFTEAMHSITVRPATALAKTFDFAEVERLLDVGGGSGAISIAVAKAWQTQCTIFELPSICRLAEEYIEAAKIGELVQTVEGDMFWDTFPSDYDAVLFSQILHDWPVRTGRQLLEKAHSALPEDGLVLIHEKLVDDSGLGPLANALVNLDMLVWTKGQQYSEVVLRRLLAETGFTDVQRINTTGYWSLVWARKG